MTDCEKWRDNKLINPKTGRSIKKDGPTYKTYVKKCGSSPRKTGPASAAGKRKYVKLRSPSPIRKRKQSSPKKRPPPRKRKISTPVASRSPSQSRISEECKSYNMDGLKGLAKSLGIANYDTMKKLALCEAIENLNGFKARPGPIQFQIRGSSFYDTTPVDVPEEYGEKTDIAHKIPMVPPQSPSKRRELYASLTAPVAGAARTRRKWSPVKPLIPFTQTPSPEAPSIIETPRVSPKVSPRFSSTRLPPSPEPIDDDDDAIEALQRAKYEKMTTAQLHEICDELGVLYLKDDLRENLITRILDKEYQFRVYNEHRKQLLHKAIRTPSRSRISEECKSYDMDGLKGLAKSLGIANYDTMKKLALCEAIENLNGFKAIRTPSPTKISPKRMLKVSPRFSSTRLPPSPETIDDDAIEAKQRAKYEKMTTAQLHEICDELGVLYLKDDLRENLITRILEKEYQFRVYNEHRKQLLHKASRTPSRSRIDDDAIEAKQRAKYEKMTTAQLHEICDELGVLYLKDDLRENLITRILDKEYQFRVYNEHRKQLLHKASRTPSPTKISPKRMLKVSPRFSSTRLPPSPETELTLKEICETRGIEDLRRLGKKYEIRNYKYLSKDKLCDKIIEEALFEEGAEDKLKRVLLRKKAVKPIYKSPSKTPSPVVRAREFLERTRAEKALKTSSPVARATEFLKRIRAEKELPFVTAEAAPEEEFSTAEEVSEVEELPSLATSPTIRTPKLKLLFSSTSPERGESSVEKQIKEGTIRRAIAEKLLPELPQYSQPLSEYLEQRERKTIKITEDIAGLIADYEKLSLCMSGTDKSFRIKLTSHIIIGSGTYGNVYEALYKGHKFAIKEMALTASEEWPIHMQTKGQLTPASYPPELMNMLRVEKLIRRIKIPNFLNVYGTGLCTSCALGNRRCYSILMERAEYTLETVRSKFNYQTHCSIMYQILAALHTMQYHYGMMHGDLKANNILLRDVRPGGYMAYNIENNSYKVKNEGFIAYLADFGISQCFKEKYSDYGVLGTRVAEYIDTKDTMVRQDNQWKPITCKYTYRKRAKSLVQPEPLEWIDITEAGEDMMLNNSLMGTKNRFQAGQDLKPDRPIDLNDTIKYPPFEFFNDVQNFIRMYVGGPVVYAVQRSKETYHKPLEYTDNKLIRKLLISLRYIGYASEFPLQIRDTGHYILAKELLYKIYLVPTDLSSNPIATFKLDKSIE